MIFTMGPGNNAKSTRVARLESVLGKVKYGGYAATPRGRYFTTRENRDPEAPMPFLNSLEGARFIEVIELDENDYFNTGLMKMLTEQVSSFVLVRTCHDKRPGGYNPQFGMIATTNHPTFFGDQVDNGTRRLVVIDELPFNFVKKVELQCMGVDDDGFVSLLTDDGGMREDIKLPNTLNQAPPDAEEVSKRIQEFLEKETGASPPLNSRSSVAATPASCCLAPLAFPRYPRRRPWAPRPRR